MIIWTNGCFDILHVGHVEMLEFAKSKGHYLVVGLDTDARVSLAKGSDRPYNTLDDRMKIIAALKCVDQVVSFGTDEELFHEIAKSCAELIVIGDDYKNKRVIGSKLAAVHFFPKTPGHSSTGALSAIRI